jgi:hypothetical protein
LPGTYKQQISVAKNLPTAVVVLVDQSSSMSEPWGVDNRPKSVAVARMVNTALAYIVSDCARGEVIRDYIHIGVIGYGGGGATSLLGGGAGGGLATASALEQSSKTEEVEKDDGTGNLIKVRVSKWFDPVAGGGTPMADALRMAEQKLDDWLRSHPDSFPPIVLNITDGQPQSMPDAQAAGESLTRLSTSDGNVLLFSCHVSEKAAMPIQYPTEDGGLPDEFARFLFGMSSDVPDALVNLGGRIGLPVRPGSRGFVFNADPVALIKFLKMGTVLTQMFDR